MKPDQEKLRAVEEYTVPTTKKQVRGFLGLPARIQSLTAVLLTDLTRKSLPDKTPECKSMLLSFRGMHCVIHPC